MLRSDTHNPDPRKYNGPGFPNPEQARQIPGYEGIPNNTENGELLKNLCGYNTRIVGNITFTTVRIQWFNMKGKACLLRYVANGNPLYLHFNDNPTGIPCDLSAYDATAISAGFARLFVSPLTFYKVGVSCGASGLNKTFVGIHLTAFDNPVQLGF